MSDPIKCPRCDGLGYDMCPSCQGTGYICETHRIPVENGATEPCDLCLSEVVDIQIDQAKEESRDG